MKVGRLLLYSKKQRKKLDAPTGVRAVSTEIEIVRAEIAMGGSQLNVVVARLRGWTQSFDPASLADAPLIERFLVERDEAAFKALLRRHGPMVLGVCRRILGNAADAEDAFQATFLVFVRKLRSIRHREQLGNWLYGVAFRTAQKARSSMARRSFKERQVSPRLTSTNADPTTADDLHRIIDEELNRLPHRYRLPVVLCDLEGRSRAEVARELGCVAGTLSSRLARGRQLLAERLSRRGVTLSVAGLLAALTPAANAAVPMALVCDTARAATALAGGNAVLAKVVSTKVAFLTEGVLRAMWLTKLKCATTIVLGVLALTWTVGALSRGGAAEPGERGLAAQERVGVPDPGAGEKIARPETPMLGRERFDQLIDALLKAKKTDGEIAEALFLATVIRLPTDAESKRVADFMTKQKVARKDPKGSWGAVLHALINSDEFLGRMAELNRNNPFRNDADPKGAEPATVPAKPFRGADPKDAEPKAIDPKTIDLPAIGTNEPNTPNDVSGFVKQIDAKSGLLTISVEAGDGLQKGQELFVYRLKPKPVFLGILRITDTRPNEVVAKIVGNLKASPLTVGDHVSSSLLSTR